MNRIRLFAGCVLVALGLVWILTPAARAQNNPTIAEIQADPRAYSDRVVTLNGVVGAYVDENEFLLNDGTGAIVVDPGPPRHRTINVPSGTAVAITGEIDWETEGSRRVVDLDACRIVTPTETIDIRDCAFDGPPPWAGGPDRDEERDDADRDRDDDWYGVVTQRPTGVSGTWVIGGRTFNATEATRLDADDGPVSVGACVSVEYEGIRAFEIESEPAPECR